MYRYKVYGECLASELEFPLLTPTDERDAAWVLRVSEEPPVEVSGAFVLGEENVAGIDIRLVRHDAGFRVEHDDTGVFDISADGRELRWYRRADVDWDVLCADVTGRVIAVALHLWGNLTLHGSAVLLGEEGVAFLAPKTFGKSTISMALTAAGARLASDDMVTVEPHAPVMAWPGLGSLRLLPHTAEALRVVHLADPPAVGHKSTITKLPGEKVVQERFPLTAIYLLTPVERLTDSDAAVERVRLESVGAVLAVVPNTKVGSLLGGAEAATVLQRVARLANLVPVYALRVVRDLDRLPEVVEQLFAWHGAVPSEERLLEAAS